MRYALVVVDVQNDFCEGGTLAASETASLLPALENCIVQARRSLCKIIFTQDWHPVDHHSFLSNGGRWPMHCVAGSSGAQLKAPLLPHSLDFVVRKGAQRDLEGYSAFEGSDLAEQLTDLGIKSIAICGIATEYCVFATALDAIKFGQRTIILTDLVRPVDPDASQVVFFRAANAGVELFDSESWLEQIEGP